MFQILAGVVAIELIMWLSQCTPPCFPPYPETA